MRAPLRSSPRAAFPRRRQYAALLAFVSLLPVGCRDAPTAPLPATAPTLGDTTPRRAVTAAAATWYIHELPMASHTSGGAVGINDDGIAVGWVSGGTPASAVVRWLPNGSLEPLPLQDVAGIANDGSVGGEVDCKPAVWHPTSGVTRLPTMYPDECVDAVTMSRSGAFVAYNTTDGPVGSRYYVYTRAPSGDWQRAVLVAPNGYDAISVRDAHPVQGAVGMMTAGSRQVAFRWTSSGGYEWLAPGVTVGTSAEVINGAGVIAGHRMDAGGLTLVHFANGAASPLAIPYSGMLLDVTERTDYLVGGFGSSQLALADDGSVFLPGLSGPPLTNSYARALNEGLTLVGWATNGSGRNVPALWNTTPPPPPYTFFVEAGGPYSGSEGQIVAVAPAMRITGGTPPYALEFDYGDGTVRSASISHFYPSSGTYTITVKVTDAAGYVVTDQATLVIANTAPSLLVRSVSPTTIPSGGSVWVEARYDDAGRYDAPWTLELTAYGYPLTPGGPPSAIYSASASSSLTPPAAIGASITLRRAGPYNLVVSLRDKDGAYNTAPAYSVSVQRLVVTTTAASSGELLSMTFAGSASVPAAGVALATVRLGDGVVEGVPIATGADGRPIATLGDVTGDGIADLVLAFRWADLEASGALSVPARGLVLRGDMTDERQFEGRAPVPPRPPVVTAGGPYFATEGAPIAFDATATGGTAPLALRWSFGDGAEATTLAPTHAYVDDGTYTVTFTATDAAGQVATGTTTATIANAPPVLTLGPGATIYSGDAFTARGHVTDAGVADAPWRWTVQWPDGTAASTGDLIAVPGDFAATAVLRRAGTTLVAVRVVDADGGVASGTVSVVVRRLEVPMSVSPSRLHPAERGKGLLTVTLKGTARVAVDDVVVESVRLNGVPVDSRGDDVPRAGLAGWRDGDSALVLKFRRDALAAVGPSGLLVLQADLRDGRQIEARYTLERE